MGSEQVVNCVPKITQSYYLPCGNVQLYHFGNVQVLQNQKTLRKFFYKDYDYPIHKESFPSFCDQLMTMNNSCNFLLGIEYIECLEVSLCSNRLILRIYFEYLENNLYNILKHRNNGLPQSEIISLLQCLLFAISYLNIEQMYHGDLCPQFIYVNGLFAKYKICDSSYFIPNQNGYYRAQNEKTYCAPEILNDLRQKRIFPRYDHILSDVFSVGLIALQCMTLISPLEAYTNNQSIDFYFIENLMRVAMKANYKEQILDCVSDCIKLKDRPNARELLDNYSFLVNPQHQNKISLRNK